MRKKLAQEDRRKVGDDELEPDGRKLRTFAVVMAVMVAIGLLGLTLVTLCDQDWEGDWPSVCSPQTLDALPFRKEFLPKTGMGADMRTSLLALPSNIGYV